VILAGAYNATIDGLTVINCSCGITVTPGESLFYNPWSG